MYNLGRHLGTDLPEVHLHPELIDRVLEVIAAILFILIWVAFVYLHLPEGETRGTSVLNAAMGSFIMALNAGSILFPAPAGCFELLAYASGTLFVLSLGTDYWLAYKHR